MSCNKYLIVFDTNILHVEYKKKGDFTKFHFNHTLENIAGKIEELDIYQYVSIAIPEVVWDEMKQQKIEAYTEKLEEMQKKAEKFTFPFHKWNCNQPECTYEEYLDDRIAELKENMHKSIVDYVILNLPSEERYGSILNRAFRKLPPFEGKKGVADKGFKDALLWESTLEYKSNNEDVNIILYTDDNIFNSQLKDEYTSKYPDASIEIFNKESEDTLLKHLEKIAKEEVEFAYIPEGKVEYPQLKEWLNTGEFYEEIAEYSNELIGTSEYLTLDKIEIKEIYDIIHEDSDDGIHSSYTVDLAVLAVIKVLNKAKFEDTFDITINIDCIDETVFTIDWLQVNQEDLDE